LLKKHSLYYALEFKAAVSILLNNIDSIEQ